jgi:hypothetical protein
VGLGKRPGKDSSEEQLKGLGRRRNMLLAVSVLRGVTNHFIFTVVKTSYSKDPFT